MAHWLSHCSCSSFYFSLFFHILEKKINTSGYINGSISMYPRPKITIKIAVVKVVFRVNSYVLRLLSRRNWCFPWFHGNKTFFSLELNHLNVFNKIALNILRKKIRCQNERTRFGELLWLKFMEYAIYFVWIIFIENFLWLNRTGRTKFYMNLATVAYGKL